MDLKVKAMYESNFLTMVIENRNAL